MQSGKKAAAEKTPQRAAAENLRAFLHRFRCSDKACVFDAAFLTLAFLWQKRSFSAAVFCATWRFLREHILRQTINWHETMKGTAEIGVLLPF